MDATLVVAFTYDLVMGHQGKLPWRIREEMQHFVETTMGHCCIMGRKTWDSIPPVYRPLKGRINIVVTSKTAELCKEVTPDCPFFVAPSLEKALRIAEIVSTKSAMIIGGETLYRQALEAGVVTRIIASIIKGEFEGEILFPKLGPEFPIEAPGWTRKTISFHETFRVEEYLKAPL
jgi:dihydrofolate reductase